MSRTRVNLNRAWRFFRGDVAGAEAVDFDDSSWQPVGLPHTFDLPYFRTPEFYVGVGWYRKRLDVPPQWQHRHYEFDAYRATPQRDPINSISHSYSRKRRYFSTLK